MGSDIIQSTLFTNSIYNRHQRAEVLDGAVFGVEVEAVRRATAKPGVIGGHTVPVRRTRGQADARPQQPLRSEDRPKILLHLRKPCDNQQPLPIVRTREDFYPLQ